MSAPFVVEAPVGDAQSIVGIAPITFQNYDGYEKPNEEGDRIPGVVDSAALYGTYLHSTLATAFRDLPEERQQQRFSDLYGESPSIVQAWVTNAGDNAVSLAKDLLTPAPGREAVVVPEVRFQRIGKVALDAADVMFGGLSAEQAASDGSPGRIERLISVAPHLLEPYAPRDAYDRILAEPAEGFPISPADIDQHLDNMRAYRFAEQAKLVYCPGARPDLMSFEYDEKDVMAKHVASAFVEVLKAGAGYDAQKLAEQRVKYIEMETNSGEETVHEIPALDAAYLAFNLILEGRLSPKIVDYKSLPHVGENWKTLNKLWSNKRGEPLELSEIFDNRKLDGSNPRYQPLREKWNAFERSASLTMLAVSNWMSFVLKEIEARQDNESASKFGYPDDLASRPNFPRLSLPSIIDKFTLSIFLADTDISNPHTAPEEDNGNRLAYQVSPPLHMLGVPEKVRMMEKRVRPERMHYYWAKWEHEVRDIRICSALGHIATAQVIEHAKQSQDAAAEQPQDNANEYAFA